MTTQIISDVNFVDPGNLIPFLEKDDAIIRGVTKGMLDFSNPASWAGGANTSGGAIVKSLTTDGGNGVAGPFAMPVANGLMDVGNGNTVATQNYVTLPDTFKLPNTCKRFLAIVWGKIPSSGYQTVSNGVSQSLLGYMNNTGTLAQWGIFFNTDQATGLPVSFSILTPSNGGVATQESALGAVGFADGQLHQFALYFDGESVPGQRTRAFYADKAAIKVSDAAWDGTFNVPAANARLGYNVAFQGAYPNGFKVGRPSLWDLTGTPWTPAQILQRDWDAAQGFLG